ncbi:epidermal growth factor receptor substrate 15-like 1 isoform X3 [Sitophilus oryzae]|uniref:Epidermal growth factor receptor substrate 15-like 1 isoform X3 n=1 Tax=Sitophilus oryzae TaxID=7048 RepID=A0A6J2YIZ5_SITOR|nr:epidermal growth factor receptor substrate 15-like 1 isoform X3 [Sitophilus oryzae]
MAALPSPTQVAGNHMNVYEAYYNVVDPNGFGSVGGLDAARFLKRSGLSDVILSRIWDLSDPGGRGSLDKAGMFVALKLVALVQNGKDLSVNNINEPVPPPKMGDIPIPKTIPPRPSQTPLITSLPPSAVDWTIKPTEREKYDRLFDSLQPLNGLIPGNKVKNVLMQSKLPFDTLGKIWDLADQDKDGMLNRHEFVVAMHLVYKALEKYAIPNTLPAELLPPAKENSIPTPLGTAPIISRPLDGVKPEVPPPPVVQPIIPPTKPVQSVQPTISWVVTPEEKAKSDALFLKSDVDKDGFVSGGEIKDVFLRSGVPQQVLAHIWALCDIKQTGKLNNEQFALAMWFVARCLKGMDPPPSLTPEMIPPSFRSTKPTEGVTENNNTRYSNPELDMISKDIEELCKEKLALETDIAQKEADIKIKVGEIKNLQSELDTLSATLKQLENQKGEAQKRLNDLKAQVDKLRIQAVEQAELLTTQENELRSKKEQLDGLKQEEERLEQQISESMKKLDSITTNLQDTQLRISQTKALITQLQEQTRQINDAIALCDTGIESGDVNHVPDTALRIKPEFRDPEYSKLISTNGEAKQNFQNGFGDDAFNHRASNGGFEADPFKSDPFKPKNSLTGNDPFTAAFTKPIDDGFSADPFGGSFATTNQADPFNSFDNPQKPQPAAEPDKDPFGCDPFAVLHAPTRAEQITTGSGGAPPPRPSSPSPALPPKKSKQPPPRPAPPRPSQPPAPVKKQQDAFGSDPFGGEGGDGFADFANFDSKCLHRSYLLDIISNSMSCPLFKSWFSDWDHPKFPPAPPPPPTTRSTANLPPVKPAPPTKGLDFSDDPFKDYRYEDPFNITFEDDDDDKNGNSSKLDPNATTFQPYSSRSEAKFDPFGAFELGGRQSVPLPKDAGSLSFSSGRASAPIDLAALPTEDQQMAWAARESLEAERERRERRKREEEELEMALSLSKIEVAKR